MVWRSTVQGAIEAVKDRDAGITLHNGELTALDVRPFLEALKDNSSVTELALEAIRLKDAGAALVADMLRHNSIITELTLHNNKIGVAGAVAIAGMLKENSSIHTLSLSGTKIGDAVAVAIAEMLKENSSIRSLDLRSNDIGEAGAMAIAEMLKENSSIHTLDLEYNDIGDAGAMAIAEMLQVNSSIHTLNLGWNELGDAGVEAIAKMLKTNASLTTLRLHRNTCTAKGGEALAAAIEFNEVLKDIWLPENILDGSKARIDARVAVVEQHSSDFGAKGLQMLNSNIKVRWGRAKFMVVGKGAVGKSSFIRTLLGQPPVEVYDSTIGVDLKLTRSRDWAVHKADASDLDEQLAKAQFLAGGAPPPTSALAPVPVPASASAAASTSTSVSASASASAPAPAVQVEEKDIAKSYRADLKARVQQDGDKTVAEEVSFTIWDYGGQEVFYSLHHLFLTSNGVYVLAFDMRELLDKERFAPVEPYVGRWRRLVSRRRRKEIKHAAEQHRAAVEVHDLLLSSAGALATLRFWLDSIALHAPDADVVLVGTHMDAVSRREDWEAVDEQLKSLDVHRSAHTVRNNTDGLCFFPVDNMDRSEAALERVQRLRDVVVGRVKDADFVKCEVPLRWALLLEKMLDDKGRNYMELGDVKKLALDVCGIHAHEVTTQLLPFLHELGVVVHLTATATLASIVVTRPQWLLDNLSRVICDPRHMETHVKGLLDTEMLSPELQADIATWEAKGIATRALLEWLWQGRNVDYFVDLMQQMLLACPHPDGGLLVPSLLQRAPESLAEKFEDCPLAYVQCAVLPRGVFQRFVTSCIIELAQVGVDAVLPESAVYANAAIVVVGNVRILLEEQPATRRVHVRLGKSGPALASSVIPMLMAVFESVDAAFMRFKLDPRLVLSADGTDAASQCVLLEDVKESTDDYVPSLDLKAHALAPSAFSFFLAPPPTQTPSAAAAPAPASADASADAAGSAATVGTPAAAASTATAASAATAAPLAALVARLDQATLNQEGILRRLDAQSRAALSREVATVPPLWIMSPQPEPGKGRLWDGRLLAFAKDAKHAVLRTSGLRGTYEIRMLCQLTGECLHVEPVVVKIKSRRALRVLSAAKAPLELLAVAAVVGQVAEVIGKASPAGLPAFPEGDGLEAATELAETAFGRTFGSAKAAAEELRGASEDVKRVRLQKALLKWDQLNKNVTADSCSHLLALCQFAQPTLDGPTIGDLSGLQKATTGACTCMWISKHTSIEPLAASLGISTASVTQASD